MISLLLILIPLCFAGVFLLDLWLGWIAPILTSHPRFMFWMNMVSAVVWIITAVLWVFKGHWWILLAAIPGETIAVLGVLAWRQHPTRTILPTLNPKLLRTV